ncbi:hypothetical protein SEA_PHILLYPHILLY_17 [Microbacterium phage PhillyPhilly]|nr:hypothetical protein SEA_PHILLYPHILLY_17 [Microbacterium phage PhillyPhilly]
MGEYCGYANWPECTSADMLAATGGDMAFAWVVLAAALAMIAVGVAATVRGERR